MPAIYGGGGQQSTITDLQILESATYKAPQTKAGDGTTTIDWGLGNKAIFTFGAQNETFTFTAPPGVANLQLVLIQDGTGSRTATWPGTVKWPASTAPTLTTAGAGKDIISFFYDGTNYYAVSNLAFG